MELSEEEKKAIEYFKKYINDEEKKLGKNLSTKFNEHLKVLLSQVDKQQKEIEDLKAITQNYNAIGGETFGDDRIIVCSMKYFDNGYFKKNYIFKDKIKNKIKEFEQIRDIIAVEENHDLNYDLKRNDYCVKMLKDLLEDNNEESDPL